MRAVVFEEFGVLPEVREVPDPVAPPGGVVIAVEATGVCRSDWHSWQGHDTSVKLPHVAGHELAGRIASLGEGVRGWSAGDRVTVPFVCACGTCAQCAAGDQQICDREFQPGATHWGSFAEYVAIENAEVNLVALPDSLSAAEAAALGCRFGTAFRAVLRQGGVRPGQQVAVYGCGGVGVSAILLAVAAGASVVAVDPSPQARALAVRMGASSAIDPSAFEGHEAVAAHVRELTGGGAHVSLDCLGSPTTCAASIGSLRKRGRHVQAGLMPPAQGVAPIPMHRVIGGELEIVGIHGLQAHEYPEMLRVVETAGIDLEGMIGDRVGLDDVPAVLAAMNDPVPARAGVTVVEFAR
ncbi:alcohol dehydrogenase catalytic domain-containing protein [Amycolatopsis roodepoortensis]|uniref:alcohol dehydrogenase catalytic domain-containing protein n=1 Tax=Amycolatopsis roodepoortensis TaxID=700274 RepID=UPI00214CE614|nr:alcohol dehydrogenase catalytic domain-containing protein [Amycolatopsis roodepoortensis]UUV28941.1 alcohol dehydrogenase catalytic domain-containing protein [Amycolatopsis roodepoortensis]